MLSQKAIEALDAATQGGYPIYVPAICLVEFVYPVEKQAFSQAKFPACQTGSCSYCLRLQVPLISRDARIRASKVQTIW